MDIQTHSPFFKIAGHEFIRSPRLRCEKISDNEVWVILEPVNSVENEYGECSIRITLDYSNADDFIKIFNKENVVI